MDAKTRGFLEAEILTIGEVARLLGLSTAAAMKQAERKEWDYVRKGRQKLYWRPDFPRAQHPQTPVGGADGPTSA